MCMSYTHVKPTAKAIGAIGPHEIEHSLSISNYTFIEKQFWLIHVLLVKKAYKLQNHNSRNIATAIWLSQITMLVDIIGKVSNTFEYPKKVDSLTERG